MRELAAAGHEVVACFRRGPDDYPDELRRIRVAQVARSCRPVYGCSFGDGRFLELVRSAGPWDLFCHHAAETAGYRSPDFDVLGAVENNTRQLDMVLSALEANGCTYLLLTGSVFENDEGAGSDGLPAVTPYGLSKALTAQIVAYRAHKHGFGLGKFVIPNPFGPFEERRFTAYLLSEWKRGRQAQVLTPAYVRDNIHVSLLAKAYMRFAEQFPKRSDFVKCSPSGYRESQADFAERVAREVRKRSDLVCQVTSAKQTDFAEPLIRVNTEDLDVGSLGWNEAQSWDEFVTYYLAAA